MKFFCQYLWAKSGKRKINGSLCCLGYPSEILRDRRDRILITSSMYCNFRRRIKGFFGAWEERVCGSVHKVRYNSWILIATANRVTICMTTDTVSIEDLFFLSTKASDGPTTSRHTCTRTRGDICTYATFCFQSHIHTNTQNLILPPLPCLSQTSTIILQCQLIDWSAA